MILRQLLAGLGALAVASCNCGTPRERDASVTDMGVDGGFVKCQPDLEPTAKCSGILGWETGRGVIAPLAVECSTCSGHLAVYHADVDEDGNTDLIYHLFTGDPHRSRRLGVLTNLGAGRFAHADLHQLPANGTAHVTDFADGRADFYYSYTQEELGKQRTVVAKLDLHQRGALPQVVVSTVTPETMKIESIAYGDFSGDGLGDLALAVFSGPNRQRIWKLGGQAGQGFTDEGFADNVYNEIGPASKLRLVRLGSRDTIALMMSPGSTTIPQEVFVLDTWWSGGGDFRKLLESSDFLSQLSVADVNDDGADDLLILSNFDLKVITNLSSDEPTILQLKNGEKLGAQRLTVGNFDGQPGLEIAADGQFFLNVIGDLMSKPRPRLWYFDGVGAAQSTAFDINNDGADDLVNWDGQELGYYPGGGSAVSSSSPYFAIAHGYRILDTHGTMTINDFDDDGLLDIVVGARRGTRLELVRGAGTGALAESETMTTEPVLVVRSADLNRDCRSDLLLARPDKQLEFRPNIGDGQFGEPILSPAPAAIYDMVIVDLDGDGIEDLAASGRPFELHKGMGDGRFQLSFRASTGFTGGNVEVRDVDGDGNLDFIVADFAVDATNSRVVVFYGDGQGGVNSQFELQVGRGAIGASAGDIDGDGISELVVAAFEENSVTIHAATSSRAFGSAGANFSFRGPRGVLLEDVNHDGRPELFVWGDGRANVHQNVDGTLSETGRDLGGGSSIEATLTDFNQDGQLDFFQISLGIGVVMTYGVCD